MGRSAANWSVTCIWLDDPKHKNAAHSWSIPYATDPEMEKNPFARSIECNVCRKEFSLFEGVKESFKSENPFVMRDFEFNARAIGTTTIVAGLKKDFRLQDKFAGRPEVYLTPQSPVIVAPALIHASGFSILSSSAGEAHTSANHTINWLVYGNYDDLSVPLWRRLLSDSKSHQARGEHRSEIVALESGVELFISEHLQHALQAKGVHQTTIDWVQRRGIEEKCSIWLREANGKSLSDVDQKLHSRWIKDLKKVRDAVVHKGKEVSSEEAIKARDAAISVIVNVCPKALLHFRIGQVERRIEAESSDKTD